MSSPHHILKQLIILSLGIPLVQANPTVIELSNVRFSTNNTGTASPGNLLFDSGNNIPLLNTSAATSTITYTINGLNLDNDGNDTDVINVIMKVVGSDELNVTASGAIGVNSASDAAANLDASGEILTYTFESATATMTSGDTETVTFLGFTGLDLTTWGAGDSCTINSVANTTDPVTFAATNTLEVAYTGGAFRTIATTFSLSIPNPNPTPPTSVCVDLGAGPATPSAKPNILFILVDDLGRQDVGCYQDPAYDNDLYETPHIDCLATQSIKFTDAYSTSPVCSPSRASIVTGKTPKRVEITRATPAKSLALEEVTIAEALKEEGYYTAHLGKWHLQLKPKTEDANTANGVVTLDYEEKYFPEKQGYDLNVGGHEAGQPATYFYPYEAITNNGIPITTLDKTVNNVPGLTGSILELQDEDGKEYLTDRLTYEAKNVMDSAIAANKPFFISLCYYTVHTPVQGKADTVTYFGDQMTTLNIPDNDISIGSNQVSIGEQFTDSSDQVNTWSQDSQQNNKQYAAMVKNMDAQIGVLMQALVDKGIADNTVIIFTSDNGGLSIGKTRIDAVDAPTTELRKTSVTSCLPLKGGKGLIYEGGIRQPLLIRWPGMTTAGTTSSQPVIHTDFYPTLLNIIGASARPNQHKDGVDISSLLGDTSAPAVTRNELYFFFDQNHQFNWLGESGAIREGDYKLIATFDSGDFISTGAELYDLSVDIGETNDLASSDPTKVASMLAKLNNWYDSTVPPTVTISTPKYTYPTTLSDYTANYGASVFADINIPSNLGMVIEASASDDDNLNASNALTYEWKQISGSGTGMATFSSTNTGNTTVTFDQDGSYILNLAVTDSDGNAGHQELFVEVGSANHGNPANNIGPDITHAEPYTTTGALPYTLTPSLTDSDGYPVAGSLSESWIELNTSALTITGNIISGSPAQGAYDLRMIADDGNIKTFLDTSFNFQNSLAFYAEWVTGENGSYVAPETDIDGDGVSNLMEYATGGATTSYTKPQGELQIIDDTSNTFLSLTIVRRKDAAARGLLYTIERSSNLKDWFTDSIVASAPTSIDTEFESVNYKLTIPIEDPAHTKFFMRADIKLDE